MMCFDLAFEITEDDIQNVLFANPDIPRYGHSVEKLAEHIFDEMTPEMFNRVTGAALNSGVDIDEQTTGAYEEIVAIIKEHFPLDSLTTNE